MRAPTLVALGLLGLLDATVLAPAAFAKIPAPVVAATPVPVAPNRPPDFELPPYHEVAPGQAIAFGLNVVDQEGDTVAVELLDQPAGATYTPLTLTVSWRPKARDREGRFRVKVTETARLGGARRAFVHEFAIAVRKGARLPQPQPLSPAVELLLTIHAPERLAGVNQAWPIDKMLARVHAVELAKLPEADRAAVKARTGGELYGDALRAMALRHGNPALDPAAKTFDARTYGDPKAWKITAVRPRLDKAMIELRIVYENVRAPEPVYLMFRWRVVKDSPDLTPEQKAMGNVEMARLTAEAFFDGPALRASFVDAKVHGKAVAAYVGAVLGYEGKAPMMGAEFMALPHEARLGGGTSRKGDGVPESGDGWAWAVLKGKWEADGDKKVLRIVSVPIPGFTTAVGKTPDGKGWKTICAPRFDPADPKRVSGWEVLCRKALGFTDLPGRAPDGKVASSPIDATNLFVDHKMGDLVASVPLRDARRDLFEENGMTCSQCHIRDFANGDLRDPALRDASLGRVPALAASIPTTFFNLVPEETWRPFMVEFQKLQECLAKGALKKHLGLETNLTCPLVAE